LIKQLFNSGTNFFAFAAQIVQFFGQALGPMAQFIALALQARTR
jgi:hypothetical protein